MAKQYGDSIRRGNIHIKKRKGIKVRTVNVPDSDEEGPHPNIDVEYARLLKTRVATSGKADSVTMTSLPLFEVKDSARDDSSELTTDRHEEFIVENVIPVTMGKKKRRKKMNDSVRLFLPIKQSSYANDPSDQDANVPGCAVNRP